jgi:hypothetical protein
MTESAGDPREQLVIDLNFVPSWARKPPADPAGRPGRTAEAAPDREERRYEDRARSPRPDRRPGAGGRREGRDRFRREREPDAARAPLAPPDERFKALEIAFLPERHGLVPLAQRLARSLRAYALFEVAAMFLTKPDYYQIKLDLPADSAGPLFQCAACKGVFADREAAAIHVFARHFDTFCRKEEREVEPPKGSFVCVARCGLSGELLGPPNHHGYADRLAEVHRGRYPEMPLEAYRKHVENSHDPELIERWKDSMKRQTVYHFGEGEGAVSFTRFSEAEAWFREHCLGKTVREGRHFTVPAAVAHALAEGGLRQAIQEAWQRESRFPLRFSITLRLAFRHLGLHTFKTGQGHTFLTSVVPTALDPSTAVPPLREILDFVTGKPGCTRVEMLAGLRTEAPLDDPNAPAVAEVNTHLRWLVEKGHVIEFSDGRLAVPTATVAKVQMAGGRHKGGRSA